MTRVRLSLVAILSALLLVGLVGPAVANDDFRFEGRGWGHGIGMTQYGALEQARDNRSATQIIEYYYRGAAVAKPSLGLGRVRVGLSQNNTGLRITAHGAKATVDFAGEKVAVPAGSSAKFQVYKSDGRCHLTEPQKISADTCKATVTWASGGSLGLSNEGHKYGHGRLLLVPVDTPAGEPTRFHVVNDLPSLDTYMLGIHEVPSSWPREALRAQAIAARSYAAFALLGSSGPSSGCSCHLYDTVSSQVYAGLSAETSAWRSAVQDTAGKVVYAGGQAGTRKGVVQAFYSSSSGGRTENIEDVWRGSSPRPYYSSVKDPWSLRGSNPYRSWAMSRSESGLRSQLKSAGVVFDDLHTIRVVERNESGSARTVRVTGIRNGSSKAIHLTGDQARSVFKLRSAYIDRVFLPPFVDDDGLVHEASIIWLAGQGITHGCNPPDNDRFCPGESITRGQMAAFLVRAFGLSEMSNDGNFQDVPKDHTFHDAINKLATEGITRGCNPPDNTRFCPDERVTRAQMAAFLVRAFELSNMSNRSFSDVRKDHTFHDAINKLATEGITRGCNPPDNTRFCPGDAVTRAQMATFLSRAPW